MWGRAAPHAGPHRRCPRLLSHRRDPPRAHSTASCSHALVHPELLRPPPRGGKDAGQRYRSARLTSSSGAARFVFQRCSRRVARRRCNDVSICLFVAAVQCHQK
ncbi:hypothetical protein U9M48_008904 [Paspalum notatum var. saurae]|uniref:Uncharacterized protein n=1 Tax=Paspalum notatum var. saurae TaxID=547442 RepID=A0AAQ3WEE7_PASNO